MKNILVTGGCGYVGTELVKNLLNQGYRVTNIDTQWFGNNLKKNKNLKNIKCDIRNIKEKYFRNIDCVIHLANIANDPAVELNPTLSWEVNVLSSYKIANLCIKYKIKKLIYASSGSVYGVKKEKKVTEDLDLVPISVYNKTKMVSERVLLSYQDKLKIYCIRPATVCGVSDRMRLDLSVNLLTHAAYSKNKITVLGGSQIRPNIHIKDMISVYNFFLKKNVKSGCYNAGFENISILKIAKLVNNHIKSKIVIKKSNDPRSYRQDSSKLLKLGFKTKYDVEYAIKELLSKFKKLKIKKSFYTVEWMKKINTK